MTKAQAILAGTKTATPIIAVVSKKKKKEPTKQLARKGPPPPTTLKPPTTSSSANPKTNGGVEDLWGPTNGINTATAHSNDVIATKAEKDHAMHGKSNKGIRKRGNRMVEAPAVEIDAAGCSFNPDREAHQDAVAVAVAAEMKKIYDKELQPTAPLALVDYDPHVDDELDMLQVDAEEEEEEEEADEQEEEGGVLRMQPRKKQKKTQKDRSKELRRKAEEQELQRRRKEKKQRRDLSELKQINAGVEETLAEREARRTRRQADEEEKAASAPPRLGRHKFEPLPVQVLTTEELEEGGGSLRRLKSTPVLAKERFKSLQRRGMIEPRVKAAKKGGKKRVEYIRGERADKARERQAEVEALRSGKVKVRVMRREKK